MVTVPMPTKQTIGQQIKEAKQTPFQNLNTDSRMFGGAQAELMGKMGNVAKQVGSDALAIKTHLDKQQDERSLMEAEKMINDWVFDQYHGENGLYTKKGNQTKNATKDIGERYNEFVNSAQFKDLQLTERGRITLDKFVNSQRNSVSTTTAKYETSEMRAYDDGLREARIQGAREDAATHYTDPDRLAEAKSKIQSTVRAKSEANGWDPEQTQQVLEDEVSSMHKVVIDRMLKNNDGVSAKEYLSKNRKEIDGDDIADIEKAVAAGEVKQQSQMQTDIIMSKYKNVTDETDALAEARKIKDPEVRDEVVRRVTNRFGEMARAKSVADRQARADAWEIILNGGGVSDLDSSVVESLGGPAVSAMKSFEKKRAIDGAGWADVTTPETYNKLHDMSVSDPKAFMNYDLNGDINTLSETDYKYWNAQQRSMKDAKAKADQKALEREANYTLGDRLSKEYLTSAGIKYGSSASGTDDAKKSQKVLSAVRSLIDRAHETDQPITRDDIEKKLAGMFVSGEMDESGYLWDDTGRKFEFTGTDVKGTFILTNVSEETDLISKATGVPPELVNGIANALSKKDIPVTLENIREVYKQGQ